MADPDNIDPRQYFNDVEPYGYIIRLMLSPTSTPDYWSGSGWNMRLTDAFVFNTRADAEFAAPFAEEDNIKARSHIVPVWRDAQGNLVESAPQTRKQITEAKVAGDVLKARIWEAYEAAMQDYAERYDKNLDDLAVGLKQSGGQGRVPWPKVPAARLKRIWLDFGKSRVVRDEKGLDEIAEIVMNNIARLRAATDMMGHSQMDARSFLDDMGHEFTDEEWDDWMSNWMTDERGNWVLSDYGMEPLEKTYTKIFSAPTAEDKLYWIDRALNVVHQRSDLASLFVEGGSTTLQQIFNQGGYTSDTEPVRALESEDPDSINPREYVLGGNWKYVVVYSGGRGRKYFDLKAFEDGKIRRVADTTPWSDDAEKVVKFDKAEAEKWQKYWQGVDFEDNAQRYSISPVTPDSILPPRNVQENEEPDEPEEVDPDVPVDPKKFLMRLDFRGEERIKALKEFGEFTRDGYWYVPFARIGYEADFTDQANYKHFKDTYKFLSPLDGGMGNAVGFDIDNYPEEYASFEEFIAQIDETEWDQFIDDVRASYNGTAIDDQEAFRLEQEETMRYIEEDFLPDFKRELKELPQFGNSFLQYAISQLTKDLVWELVRAKEKYPEPEGSGHVHLRTEDLTDGFGADQLMELFEDIPLKEQWNGEKKMFYASEQGRWFDKFLSTAVAANSEAQHAYAQLSGDDVFLLLKSLVPDSNFADTTLPRWDEVEQRAGIEAKATHRWVVTYPVAKQWDNSYWHRYTQSALQDVAELAAKRLPTWSRPVEEHPEFPMWESGPDDINPSEYLQAVGSYWGIGHQNSARTVWYTGNPWDKWSFEIDDAKRFKDQEEAASFCRTFGPGWHVDIKPIRLPELHQESVDPDAVNPREYLSGMGGGFVAVIVDGPRRYYFNSHPHGWWTQKEKAKIFTSAEEAQRESTSALPPDRRPAVKIEPALVNEARIRKQKLPPEEDIDYKSWVLHGGYDSGKELYSDETVRILIPQTFATLEKYGFHTSVNYDHSTWDNFAEPGPLFLVIPTNGRPWLIREWYDDIREANGTGGWYTAFPDDLVKTHPEGVKAGQVLAKFFKKKLNSGEFDKYFKFVFGFGGLGTVKGYLRRMRPGSDGVMDNSIALQAIGQGDVKTASKFFQYPAEALNRDGVWLYYNDYSDLSALFGEDRHHSYKSAAEKIFNNDTYDWFDFLRRSDVDVSDMTRYFTPEHYEQIREALDGRSILIDDEPVLLTPEVLKNYSDKDIEDWLEHHEDYQDDNDLEEIVEAIQNAGVRALETIYADAYFKGYLETVEEAFGSKPEWKKTADGKDKLAFFVSWKTIREWFLKFEEDHGETYSGRIDSLAEDTLKLQAADEYHGSLSDDKQVVVDSLSEMLAELKPVPYREHVDPQQPDLFGHTPADNTLGYHQVYNEHYPNGATVQFTNSNWEKFKQEHPEQTSKEAWANHVKGQPPPPALGEAADPDDARDFLQRMPLHYIIVQNWSSPTRDYVDYWSGDRGGWSAEPDHALKFTSYDQAKAETDKMFARGSSVQHQYEVSIKPVYESAPLNEALLQEGYKYAVVLIDAPRELSDHIINWGKANIPDDWLYVDEDGDSKGREVETHITVKYGLTVNAVPDVLRDIAATTRPFPVFFEKISLFNTSPDYDVVKIGIESPWLRDLNKRISSSIPHEDKHPVYNPHCTIAYVKKGVADKLVGLDIFGPGGVKPQFTAYQMEFKGACEDNDDPNRVKEMLSFSTTKKPQTESGPDDVNPRDYLNDVPVDTCNFCGADFGKRASIRRDYINKTTGEPIARRGHMTKEGFFEPDEMVHHDLTGYDLQDDSDFCDSCGRSLLGKGVWESGPDDVSAKEYLTSVPIYYSVIGRWKDEFWSQINDEAREHMPEYFWFDSAGGMRHTPHRMSHKQALAVQRHVQEENPFLNVEVVPANEQSQMTWQGRPYPGFGESFDPDAPQGNELGKVPVKYIVKYEWGTPRQGTTTWYWGGFNWEEQIEKAHGFHSLASAEMFARKNQIDKDAMTSPNSIAFNRFSAQTIMESDPDEVNPKDYIEKTPVHYLIQKVAPGKGGAGTEGWYWNRQWGWRSKVSGADHYPSREAADHMISARGLGGIAKVVPFIESIGPDPFGQLPFPSDASQLIRFFREKRQVRMVL